MASQNDLQSPRRRRAILLRIRCMLKRLAYFQKGCGNEEFWIANVGGYAAPVTDASWLPVAKIF